MPVRLCSTACGPLSRILLLNRSEIFLFSENWCCIGLCSTSLGVPVSIFFIILPCDLDGH